ncbi:Calx-beta domain-containing protein [Aeromonas veronii]|uniref:Calx-beta domain-containing protein n=1 Tax=Aeromonas veronii TaxID=654 RepID=UPI002445377E|nr:hypothetical protein [Aeromonas veronii]
MPPSWMMARSPTGRHPDDDRPTLSVTDAGEVSEGSNAVFTVGLTHATEAPLTINLGLDLGTAEAGDLGTLTVTYVDSNGATQTLTVDGDGNVTVPAGVTSLTVTVATTDDSVYEGDETFSLKVTEAGGVTTNGSTGVTGNATIVDDGSVTHRAAPQTMIAQPCRSPMPEKCLKAATRCSPWASPMPPKRR